MTGHCQTPREAHASRAPLPIALAGPRRRRARRRPDTVSAVALCVLGLVLASLFGPGPAWSATPTLKLQKRCYLANEAVRLTGAGFTPVSYTHLTLPTIYSV